MRSGQVRVAEGQVLVRVSQGEQQAREPLRRQPRHRVQRRAEERREVLTNKNYNISEDSGAIITSITTLTI